MIIILKMMIIMMFIIHLGNDHYHTSYNAFMKVLGIKREKREQTRVYQRYLSFIKFGNFKDI